MHNFPLGSLHNKSSPYRLAVLRLAELRLAGMRLAELRLAVLCLAVLRLAVLCLAVLHLVKLRPSLDALGTRHQYCRSYS